MEEKKNRDLEQDRNTVDTNGTFELQLETASVKVADLFKLKIKRLNITNLRIF